MSPSMDGSSARRPSTSILISWFRGFDGLFVIFFKLILKYTPLLWNLQVQEPYVKKKKNWNLSGLSFKG